MTLLEIDLKDVLSETDPDDRVVVWAPVMREGPSGALVGTRRKAIPLADGVGSDEVVPGPLMVQVQCKGISDSRPREVVVPETGPVTLTALFDSAGAFTYAPPVVGRVALDAQRAEDAAVRAEAGAATVGDAQTVLTARDEAVQAATDAVTAVAFSSGLPGVISETAPTVTEMGGKPLVWFKPDYNTIPTVDTFTLSGNGLSVTATFTASYLDYDDLTYRIDWGDGTVASSISSPATHTYVTGGEYTVSLTVTDVWGAAETATARVYAYDPIPARWAFDSFSYPDGTVLAGWVNDTTKDPALTTEEGDLTWEPGDQTTGGIQAYMKAHVSGGKFVQGTPDGTINANQVSAATLPLPASSYRVAFSYEITPEGVRDSLSRVGLYLSCSPTTARSTAGTTSLSVRMLDDLRMQIHTQANGTFTSVDNVSGVPRSGRLEASFNAATGAVTITINGTQHWSGTYAGPAHGKIGIDTRRLATIDDFEAGPL